MLTDSESCKMDEWKTINIAIVVIVQSDNQSLRVNSLQLSLLVSLIFMNAKNSDLTTQDPEQLTLWVVIKFIHSGIPTSYILYCHGWNILINF